MRYCWLGDRLLCICFIGDPAVLWSFLVSLSVFGLAGSRFCSCLSTGIAICFGLITLICDLLYYFDRHRIALINF